MKKYDGGMAAKRLWCLLTAFLLMLCITCAPVRTMRAEGVSIDPDLSMTVGQHLNAESALSAAADCVLTSSRPDLLYVEGLMLYACQTGEAVLTVRQNGSSATCVVTISESSAQLSLPQDLKSVEAEAFAGVQAGCVVLPEGCESIGSRAFASVSGLEMVRIPQTVTAIAADAFAQSQDVWLLVEADSAALTYAQQAGLPYVVRQDKPDPVTYRAFAAGVIYSEPNTLHGTVNDMNAIKSVLGTMTATPYTVKTAIDPTTSGILSGIAGAFAGADDNDVSLFYYSGHGSTGGYLIGTDLTGLSPARLRAALDQIPGKKIVLVDACFSGAIIGKALQPEEATDKALADFNSSFLSAFYGTSKALDNLASDDYYVITASTGAQTSLELGFANGISFGLFTYSMSYGCGWDEYYSSPFSDLYADDNEDGMLTLTEVYDYTVYAIDGMGYSARQNVRCYPSESQQVLFGR